MFTLRKFLKILLLIFVLIISILQTSKSQEVAQPLKILSTTPIGATEELSESESIVVTFNQPMVKLQGLTEEVEGPLKIKPSVPGRYRWMGTYTLSFQPTEPLPYATKFTVIIPGDTKSFSGQQLERDYTWTFETPRPKLLHHWPPDQAQWVDLRPLIWLRFNQPMGPELAADFIQLLEAQSGQQIQIKIRHPAAEEIKNQRWNFWQEKRWRRDWRGRRFYQEDDSLLVQKILLLEPKNKLVIDGSYIVVLSAGLRGTQGPLGLPQEKRFSFETFQKFQFKSMRQKQNHNPNVPIVLTFSNPVTAAEVVSHITFEPKIEIPEYYQYRDYPQIDIELANPLQPATQYTGTISDSLTDVFGNALGTPVTFTFTTGDYPPYASMTRGKGLVEAYGDLRYPVVFINIEKVRLQLAKIQKEEIIRLFNWSDKEQRHRIFSTSVPYTEKHFEIDRDWILDLPKNKRILKPIELKEALGEDSTGVVFVQLSTEFPNENPRYFKSLLQVTHMGISAKFSPTNNLIWLTNLKDGTPVAEAVVEIRDDKNQIFWTGSTDAMGQVETPGWAKLGIKEGKWQQPRQWIFVTKGEDFAFSASDWGTGIAPYRFGINYDWNPRPETWQGQLFTERGLYRTGEQVHIKGIIRKKNLDGNFEIPLDQRVRLTIRDPRGNEILKESLILSEFGAFARSIEINENAPLGYYDVQAIIFKAGEPENQYDRTFHTSFRVEAFRPAEFEVNVKTPHEEYIFGDYLTATISGKYLFGGVMKRDKVSWRLRLNPFHFKPKGFKGYFFGPLGLWGPDGKRSQSRILASEQGTLNDQGEIYVETDLLAEDYRESARLMIEGDVQGPSRQTISGRKQVVVHRGVFYVGVKPRSTFTLVDSTLQLEIIAVSPEGASLPGNDISVSVIKRQWHSVRKAGVGGRYQWISEKVDSVVDSLTVVSANAPVSRPYKPTSAGLYFVRAKGHDQKDNRILTEAYFYVTGPGYVAWQRSDDDRIELVADAEKYKPGETAKIMVKSPFEITQAWVTLEREGILNSWVQELVGSAPSIEIPITEEHLPNLFVSVVLLQGRTENYVFSEEGEDIGRPAFKIGYINLPVDPGSQHLTVAASMAKEAYRPGEEITVQLSVKNSINQGEFSEIALAVVDAGVLNLTGYRLPDPFDSFYGPRPLSVETSETRLHLVEQRNYGEKGESRGGGGAEALTAFGGIDLRGEFKATAYWNPFVVTDAKGKATVTFKLPDNLTTWRVMAVAHTKDSKFGRGEYSFKVNKPLLLQAALPRFARINDSFEGGVVVHNNTKTPGQVTLLTEAEDIQLPGEKSFSFVLAPSEAKEVRFPFKVNHVGEARFKFKAKMNQARGPEETDGLQWSIPLQVPQTKEVVATFNETEASVTERLEIPENIFPDLGGLELTAASTALVGLSNSVDYLFTYPYGCLEQQLSRILPMIETGDLVDAFGLPALKDADYREVVNSTLKELDKFQLANGGFSYWPGSNMDSPFVSANAVYTLVAAQKADYLVDKNMLQKGVQYLKRILRTRRGERRYPYNQNAWNCTKAYVLYTLALVGQPEPAYVELLFNQKETLPLFARAYLLKAIHVRGVNVSMENVLQQILLNKIKIEPTQAHFEEDNPQGLAWIWHSNTRTTALILDAILETQGQHPLAAKIVRWLLEKRRNGRWRNTQENIYVFRALSTYFRLYEIEEPEFTAEFKVAGKTVLEQAFQGRSLETHRVELKLNRVQLGQSLPLEIQKSGTGRLYYGARMTYFPRDFAPAREEGFAIFKEMVPFDTTKTQNKIFKPGSLVKVNLRIITPQERNYVVVDDPLPAGFEAVNLSFQTESRETARELRGRTAPMRKKRGRPMLRHWGGFNHKEMHDDRVLLFADYLPAGVHSFTYLARATTYGTFVMPPTHVEEMYSPEVFGRTEGGIVVVEGE